MIEYLAECDCGLKCFFGVKFEQPISNDELRDRITAKLGDDGAYICPRCQSLVLIHVGDSAIASPERLRRAEQAQRIGRSTKGIRFGVGEPDGARSSVWRVWMNNRRDDVYISARGLASDVKVSLHPEYWYFGFTKRYAERATSLLPPGADRRRHVWDRPGEFGPGWTRAFVIIVPASEVTEAPVPYNGREAVWLPAPAAGEAVHFSVLLSKPDAARGRRGYPSEAGYERTTEFVTRLSMATGEQLWILAHVAPMSVDETARVKRARDTLETVGREELMKRASEDPEFSARAMIFGESADGVAAFIDVSLSKVCA